MADESTSGTAEETTTAAAVTNGATDRRKMTREQQEAADREAFLSGAWEKDEDGDPAPAKPAPKKPAAKVEEPKDEDIEDQDDDLDEDDAEDEIEEAADKDDDLDDEDDDQDEDEETSTDPEVAKRLDSVRRAEQRLRARHDEREKKFASEREAFIAEWKPRVADAQEFAKLKASANPYNAAKLLLSLGLTEDELEEAARDVFAHSTKGKADPKNKEAIARSRDMRSLADRLAATEKKLADREDQDRKRAEDQAIAEASRKVLVKTAKAIGDEQPLLKRIKNPQRLHEKLAEATIRLQDKLGEMPKARRVVRYAEKLYRRELEEMGVDVEAIAKAPAKAATGDGKAAAAGEKKKPAIEVVDKTKAKPAAKTTTNGRVTLPSREQILAGMEKIQRGEDPDAD